MSLPNETLLCMQTCTESFQEAAIESFVSEIDIIIRVQTDMAGLEILEGLKVDDNRPRGSQCRSVGVPPSRPTSDFGLHRTMMP